MIIWEIITNIFWALVITIVLWILCAFTGKLVNLNYRNSVTIHLVCLVIAIPTVILLTMFFTSSKVNRVEASVTKLLLADESFTNKIGGVANTNELVEFDSSNFSDRIASEFPMLRRYMNTDKLLENIDISNLSQAEIVQAVATGFTKSMKDRVKSTRRKILIAVVLLQAIPFGITLYKASQYRSPRRLQAGYYRNPTRTRTRNNSSHGWRR